MEKQRGERVSEPGEGVGHSAIGGKERWLEAGRGDGQNAALI